ncbi:MULTISPECIES: amino acid adenylation domain-containing protein [unclassified Paenibacillus]|uniref:amino acid adenylation domain-containing protein n=1 Tax=unclassified Paenibacillus TaxID=185978 RepID=UPI0030F5CCF9
MELEDAYPGDGKYYWKDKQTLVEKVSGFPRDCVHVGSSDYPSSVETFLFPDAINNEIKRITKKSPYAEFMMLNAGVIFLLSKYGRVSEVIAVTPLMNQWDKPDVDVVKKLLIPVCFHLKREMTFKSYMDGVRKTLQQALNSPDSGFHPLPEMSLPALVVHRDIHYLEKWKADLCFSFYSDDCGRIALDIEFHPGYYDAGTIRRIFGQLNVFFEQVLSNTNTLLKDVQLLTNQEQQRIITEYNETASEYPEAHTIDQLFERVAECYQDRVAITCDSSSLTYKELDQLANVYARQLRKLNLPQETIVGVKLDKSIDLVAAALGILKSGAAYLPIDPEMPAARMKEIIEDSRSPVIITSRRFADTGGESGQAAVIYTEDLARLNEEPETASKPADRNPGQLAYVIYTSGSTGRPKGVMIEHRNVAGLLSNNKSLFDFNNDDIWTMFHSFSFDFSVWEMYGPLLNGGHLIIVPKEVARDTPRFRKLLIEKRVTVLNQTPGAFHTLIREDESYHDAGLSQLRYVIFGGEALNPSILRDWHNKYKATKLINMYGITETTVHVTYKEITETEISKGHSNIGRPLPTLSAYVVDEDLQLVPEGIPGELLVAGLGVARGYLNREELTEDKFIPDLFQHGSRVYRSGDLVKWSKSSELLYLGRIDQQVKIRGHRIELGEIENQLLKLGGVRNAVVLDMKDGEDSRYLHAFFTGSDQLTLTDIRSHLGQQLPDYMLPAFFSRIREIPLTSNGKVNRKQLMENSPVLMREQGVIQPRTEAERIMAGVWQDVLKVAEVGIDNHFFTLGGDSIKAIQILSKLRQKNWKVELKHFFHSPTIREISNHMEPAEKLDNYDSVSGEAALSPVQQWFLEECSLEIANHYNQGILLTSVERMRAVCIEQAFYKLMEHHDALRSVLRVYEQGTVQQIREPGARPLFAFETVDLSQLEHAEERITGHLNGKQRAMRLVDGPLLQVVHFRCKDKDYVAALIHHFVVDGVSWRIILEDFTTLYNQAIAGEGLILSGKTDSYVQWIQRLNRYFELPGADREKDYWTAVEEQIEPFLPSNHEGKGYCFQDVARVEFELSAAETEAMMKLVHHAYNTEINDILLAATALTLKQCFNVDKAAVDMESHGRNQELFEEADISRTVGWFTSIYPVVLRVKELSDDYSEYIKLAKETLRAVPNKGIGSMLLDYGTGKREHRARKPQVSFNYLGNFDVSDYQGFHFSGISMGEMVSPRWKRKHDLDISGIHIGGKLSISMTYNKHQLGQATMERFADVMKNNLSGMIVHCMERKQQTLTPSDLTLQGLNEHKLERLCRFAGGINAQLEDVYPLTPTQKMILFHSMLYKEKNSYFNQMSFDFEGSIQNDLVQESLLVLIKRYPTLRSVFTFRTIEVPVQIVLKETEVPLEIIELSGMDEEKQSESIQEIICSSRNARFHLSSSPPLRIVLVKRSNTKHLLIWNFHHILLDGWSLSIIMREFFETYQALSVQDPPRLREPRLFRDYLQWFQKYNKREEAIAYWRHTLDGATAGTQLSKFKKGGGTRQYVQEEIQTSLGEARTQGLKQLAEHLGVTQSALFLTVWGLLLQDICGTNEALFGLVISGRPTEISEIDQMVGMFINAVPVRVKNVLTSGVPETAASVQEIILSSEQFGCLPLSEVLSNAGIDNIIIDHMIIYENYPRLEEVVTKVKSTFRLVGIHSYEETSHNLNIVILPQDEYQVNFVYNSLVYAKETMEGLKQRLIEKVDMVLESSKTIQGG